MTKYVHQGTREINIAGPMDIVIMMDQNAGIKREATKPKQLKMIAWGVAMHAVADGVSWG